MRPPLAGKRDAARRLAAQVRLRLAPAERAVPAVVQTPIDPSVTPRDAGPEVLPEVVTPADPATSPEDAAARIDAARARLRASIQAPDDPGV
ncbi:MAG TPA: hypothetical protein VNA28_16665 [Solirubrobacteraceae bacterium]|nr:hypothetical protein [Solirubrobacteraceae bacterium]